MVKVLWSSLSEEFGIFSLTWPGWPHRRRRQALRRRARGNVPPKTSTDSCRALWGLWTTSGSRCVGGKAQNSRICAVNVGCNIEHLLPRAPSVTWPWWFKGNAFQRTGSCWLLPATSLASCLPVGPHSQTANVVFCLFCHLFLYCYGVEGVLVKSEHCKISLFCLIHSQNEGVDVPWGGAQECWARDYWTVDWIYLHSKVEILLIWHVHFKPCTAGLI